MCRLAAVCPVSAVCPVLRKAGGQDDMSGKGWAADERLDYKGMVYIYKGEEVVLEVLEHARAAQIIVNTGVVPQIFGGVYK